MAADSTTNLHSWASSETVVVGDDLCCFHCKQFDLGLQEELLATSEAGELFVVNSICYLICSNCRALLHVHCYKDTVTCKTNDIVDIIEELPFKCENCRNGEN